MPKQLAKCPHCGSERSICHSPRLVFWAGCQKCASSWPEKPTREEAIIAANVGCWQNIDQYDFKAEEHECVLVRDPGTPLAIANYRPEKKLWVFDSGWEAKSDWITEFMRIAR
jgi:hypothetical protein